VEARGYRPVYSPHFRRFRVQGQLPAPTTSRDGDARRDRRSCCCRHGRLPTHLDAAEATVYACGRAGGRACVRARPVSRNSTRWPRFRATRRTNGRADGRTNERTRADSPILARGAMPRERRTYVRTRARGCTVGEKSWYSRAHTERQCDATNRSRAELELNATNQRATETTRVTRRPLRAARAPAVGSPLRHRLPPLSARSQVRWGTTANRANSEKYVLGVIPSIEGLHDAFCWCFETVLSRSMFDLAGENVRKISDEEYSAGYSA